MKIKLRLTLVIFFLATYSANSQDIRSFTPDSVIFVDELTSFFESIPNKGKTEETLSSLENFLQLWVTENFNSTEKQAIYTLTNLMFGKRGSAYPNVVMLLRTLISLKNQHYATEQLLVWTGAFTQLLENTRRKNDFNTLLEFSVSLLENNLLYGSRIFSWTTNSKDFRVHFDTTFRVSFDKTNLVCKTKNDSTTIYNTSGTYYPLDFEWRGNSGKITWQRAGMDPDKVFARFGKFYLTLKSSTFTIEGVNFYHYQYFGEPLIGTLTEKTSSGTVDSASALYPNFVSDNKKLFIADLFRDVDYQGGFAMKGATILGEGNELNNAKLTFKRPYRDKNGKYDLLVARSRAFIIKPDRIVASSAGVSIFHRQDSIFHSGLEFKYMDKNREVSLLRSEKGIMESLYSDSFHNVDIDCEALYWSMDEPEIRFRSIVGIQPVSEAMFVSDKYFIEQQYDMLQGLDLTHPLIVIYKYAQQYNTDRFFVYELARYMQLPETPVELQMIRLAKYGFIYFNTDTKQVAIKEKLYHYIAAKNGKADYDVISFFSRVENKDNATLSLDNFDLTIRGVPRIFISDSQNVYITPTKEEVILRKNRNFLFSGKIEVGLFTFIATDCTFEYDTFKLNLPAIDEMRFKVKAFNDPSNEINFVDVKTIISNISGEILIDHPTNKNGFRDFPDYPIFTSKSESSVFYNQDSLHNGAYDPKTFNYNIKPFTIKQLADFSTDHLQFGGYLNSAGIFAPEVSKPLTVMPDYSLGFQIVSPPEGFSIYGNKGEFFDTVTLSNAGLVASGRIEFHNLTASGKNILLFPDSAKGVFDKLNIAAKQTSTIDFPSVSGQHLSQLWLPYHDSLTLTTNDSSMALFDEQLFLKGKLNFTPTRLTGSGTMKFLTAHSQSEKYNFGADFFSADSLDLTIHNLNEQSIAFTSKKFSAYVDLNKNTGSFKSINESSKVNFPLTRFSAGMDEFDWHINRNELVLRSFQINNNEDASNLSPEQLMDITPNGTRFTSLHPLQDSLWFYAPEATFNIADTTLLVKKVSLIKVADAAIFPGNGNVEIKANAAISPLPDALIIADTINKIHHITNAVVNIESRYSYKANGFYAYQNLVDETHTIAFDQIAVDSAYHTVAHGNIISDQNFMFSPQFAYQGKVALNAVDPQLYFDGAFKIVQECDSALSRWVSFQQRIDPDSLAFEVSPEPVEYGKKDIYAGFFHSNEENKVYPAFLSRKSYYSDNLMMSVDGMIGTQKNGNGFIIAAPDEMSLTDEVDPTQPYMKLNTDECIITASGEVDFGTDFGQVTMEAFGQTEHFIIPDSTLFEVFITLDFFFDDNALEFMANALNKNNTQTVETSNQVSKIAYQQLLGDEVSKDFLFELNTFGSVTNLPESLNKSLVISDVTLLYHPESRSFISQGHIGVGMVGGKTVNKYFDGCLEIVRKRSGDIIQLYLEIDRRNWYFFNYTGNLMQTIAADNEYNKIISAVDAEKRKEDVEKGETAYRYIISTTQKKNRFLRAIRTSETDEEDE